MTRENDDQDITLQITQDSDKAEVPLSTLRTLVEIICDRFGRKDDPDRRFEISIAVVDDDQMETLNTRFLNHLGTTDCLSFDLSEEDESAPEVSPKTFELIVNGQLAARQAERRGHSSDAELALYITHGLLHQMGFDDDTLEKARIMHETEDKILHQIGYGSVYNKNDYKRVPGS